MKQVSPLQAVAHGHLTVTLPVVGIIAFCGFIGWLLNGVGAFFIGLIVGSVIAWPFWSFLMPRWRDWVEDSGLTGDDVQCLAVIAFSSVAAGFIIRTRGIQTTQRKRGW